MLTELWIFIQFRFIDIQAPQLLDIVTDIISTYNTSKYYIHTC